MSQSDTVQRILDAAEVLFAQKDGAVPMACLLAHEYRYLTHDS